MLDETYIPPNPYWEVLNIPAEVCHLGRQGLLALLAKLLVLAKDSFGRLV
jgi:hypothetical protein